MQLIYIDGFYTIPQMSIVPGIYGYNIINKTIVSQLGSDGLPFFFTGLIEKEPNFNPEWFN